ncbi:hypothetical protein NQ317_014274, partial [Molorchus minor]
ACELPSSQNEHSHYICTDDGEVKCLPGWTGDLCDVPKCRSGCDPLQGYCNRPGECLCKLGYYGQKCNKCIPLPGCQHGYCNVSFECICHEGWDGLFCSEPFEEPHGSCARKGWLLLLFAMAPWERLKFILVTHLHYSREKVLNFGHATEIDILPLEDSFQSCVEGGYTYRRHRTHNHSLNRCQLFRRESNPPDEATTCRTDCHPTRGYCDTPGDCRCRIGWAGPTCKECQVLPGCVHGYCEKPLECKCHPGYTGILCQHPICSKTCHKERGYCRKPGECRCKVGWWGKNCEKCFSYPGCVHGTCNRPWECNCKKGWGGMLCDEELNYCEKNPNTCKNEAKCVSLIKDDGSYKCLCREGTHGKNCEYSENSTIKPTTSPLVSNTTSSTTASTEMTVTKKTTTVRTVTVKADSALSENETEASNNLLRRSQWY